jgi:Zn-dependent M32 family carboxypeptidase
MNEELELSGTDVSSDDSSSSSERSSSPQQGSESASEAASESSPKQEQYVPYDRFKELVEQKNQFAKQFEDTQKALSELRERLDRDSKPKEAQAPQADPKKMIERLRGIDPEFASYQEHLLTQLEQARQFQQQLEQQNYITSATNLVSKLQGELKVDPVLHQSYLAQIPHGTPVQHIEKAYKELHSKMEKYLEGIKRSTTATYAEAKKSDSAVPKTAKGTAPKTAPKLQFSNDREEAKSQIAKLALQRLRANNDI